MVSERHVKEKPVNVGITNSLGDSELEIMNIMWRRGESPVRQVYDEIRESRNITLPAIMLSMQRLTKRGVLQKVRGDRASIYRPLVTREALGYRLVEEVVDKILQGRVQTLEGKYRITVEKVSV